MGIYGALKPKKDTRDYKIAAAGFEFPETFSCTPFPKVKNQRSVSSCVAHATSSILEYHYEKEYGERKELSTNFIYGMQGVEFGRLDGGMYLRDACKIAKQFGDPSENTVPGNTEQPKCTQYLKDILNDGIYKEAEKALILSYAKCDNANAIKHALINYGPVLASVKWYDHYMFNGKVIQMDKTKDFGYHAITIVGYNNVGWICQNSWGRNFCGDGQFVYPYEEKLEEAWSFVDKPGNDIKKPRIMKWTNWIYKFVNYIINLFSK